MNFHNEHISGDDFVRFRLAEVDKKFNIGSTSARTWTISTDRKVYLREVATGAPEFSSDSRWTLYWNDSLIEFELQIVKTARGSGGLRWAHKKLLHVAIPAELSSHQTQIINAIYAGLLAHKDGGVFSVAQAYWLSLEIEPIAGFEHFLCDPPESAPRPSEA